MILTCIIINLITIKNWRGENSAREEGKWWGCHDGKVRKEEKMIKGVRKLRRIKWSFAKTW